MVYVRVSWKWYECVNVFVREKIYQSGSQQEREFYSVVFTEEI